MSFTINELKKHLGPGLGLRKNKYLIEIPLSPVEGETLNILCQSAGLPERNISTTEMWHKGRKYQVRGETDYVGDYEINIVDDSSMRIRQIFDSWLRKVDDSRPEKDKLILGSSFEENSQEFALGFFDDDYQVDINIWQLGRGSSDVDSDKIYGYKLQNAFPKSIGIVTLEDGNENTLSEFSVTFGFSEFIPLKVRNTSPAVESFGEKTVETDTATENSNDEIY